MRKRDLVPGEVAMPLTAQPAADVFPGNGRLPSQEEELRRKRREVESLRQERDFLKKTAAYFARESR